MEPIHLRIERADRRMINQIFRTQPDRHYVQFHLDDSSLERLVRITRALLPWIPGRDMVVRVGNSFVIVIDYRYNRDITILARDETYSIENFLVALEPLFRRRGLDRLTTNLELPLTQSLEPIFNRLTRTSPDWVYETTVENFDVALEYTNIPNLQVMLRPESQVMLRPNDRVTLEHILRSIARHDQVHNHVRALETALDPYLTAEVPLELYFPNLELVGFQVRPEAVLENAIATLPESVETIYIYLQPGDELYELAELDPRIEFRSIQSLNLGRIQRMVFRFNR